MTTMNTLQSLALLATTADARQTYGLRHDDYARYRAFCSRRVQRLRVASGLKQQVPLSVPPAAHPSDKPNKSNKKKQPKTTFEKKPISAETVSDLRHVRTLVFTAERYWAYANDLLEQAKVADPTSANQKRRHALKKLKLAAITAQSLENIVTDLARRAASKLTDPKADSAEATAGNKKLTFHATDILEVRAYASTMQGRYLIELRQWQPALDAYLGAKAAYQAVTQVCADADPTHAALCQAAMDALDPHVRFAMYSLAKLGQTVQDSSSHQDALAHLIEMSSSSKRAGGDQEDDVLQHELDALLANAGTAAASAVAGPTLTFLGTSYTLRANTPLGQFVAQLHDLERTALKLPRGSKQQLAAFQSLVSMALQAEKVAEKDVAANAAAALKVTTSTMGAQASRVQSIATACAYARRVYSVQRNMVLVNEKLGGGASALGATASEQVAASLNVASASIKAVTGSGTKRVRAKKGAKQITPSTTSAPSTKSAAADQKKRFADAIRLLDLILANLSELADLPLLASHPLATQMLARARAQFAAHRQLVLAHVYTANTKWALARAAALRGVEYLGEAEHAAQVDLAPATAAEPWMHPEMPQPLDMDAIRAELIARAGALTTAQQVLAKHGRAAVPLPPMNVAPFATVYATSRGIVPVARCVPLPVPAKPVFFDLAFAEIDFPMVDMDEHKVDKASAGQDRTKGASGKKETQRTKPERQQQQQHQQQERVVSQEEEQQASSGLSGWLGGLWGSR